MECLKNGMLRAKLNRTLQEKAAAIKSFQALGILNKKRQKFLERQTDLDLKRRTYSSLVRCRAKLLRTAESMIQQSPSISFHHSPRRIKFAVRYKSAHCMTHTWRWSIIIDSDLVVGFISLLVCWLVRGTWPTTISTQFKLLSLV